MDRYRRIENPRSDAPINDNEIRITALGKTRNYISYATSLLQEKEVEEIVLKAMGRAINKAVAIAEIIKRRVVGLHQITAIGSIDITDVWEPLEEGLLPLEQVRHVSRISITLSIKELDTSAAGYQPPLPSELVKPSADLKDHGESSARRERNRSRKGEGQDKGNSDGGAVLDPDHEQGRDGEDEVDIAQDVDASSNVTQGRGRGRGQGRLRGRGRARGQGFQLRSARV